MKSTPAGLLAAILAAATAAAVPAPAADSVKIGFVGTFSGPAAAIGNDMRDGFSLGVDNLGRQMAGRPVEVIYEDDTQKPDEVAANTMVRQNFAFSRVTALKSYTG
jgi:ABC-type branched-subunit amino acid transport system substrate-binding protein